MTMGYWQHTGLQRLDTLLGQRLLFPSLQTDMLKLLALLLMLADHANRALGLDMDGLALLGRGAFPLFGLVWCRNLARHPTLTQAGVNRLWGWAIVAQPVYTLALFADGSLLMWCQANILFAFAVAGQMLYWRQRWGKGCLPFCIALLMAWLPVSLTSYGVSGLLMLWGGWLVYQGNTVRMRLFGLAVWALMGMLMNHGFSPVMMLAAPLLAVACVAVTAPLQDGPAARQRLFGGTFFPLAYVAHLAVLAAWVQV